MIVLPVTSVLPGRAQTRMLRDGSLTLMAMARLRFMSYQAPVLVPGWT